jgi:hypothetical protein
LPKAADGSAEAGGPGPPEVPARQPRRLQLKDDAKRAGKTGFMLGAALAALLLPPLPPVAGQATASLWRGWATDQRSTPLQAARRADFGAHTPSADARELADWVAAAADHGAHAFIVVDKRAAVLHVFDASARRTATTPVLLGAAAGDHSVPGIGTRAIESIQPAERTTPAGRFLGERGRNTNGEDVIWVDYEAAISMHRVRLVNPTERRAQRLASPSADDNRISYGCINVPAAFYDAHIRPIFASRRALVYVLPDVSSIQEVFGALSHRTRPPTGVGSRGT